MPAERVLGCGRLRHVRVNMPPCPADRHEADRFPADTELAGESRLGLTRFQPDTDLADDLIVQLGQTVTDPDGQRPVPSPVIAHILCARAVRQVDQPVIQGSPWTMADFHPGWARPEKRLRHQASDGDGTAAPVTAEPYHEAPPAR